MNSQVEIETLNYIYLVFSLRVINENVDNVFIEIYRIREVFFWMANLRIYEHIKYENYIWFYSKKSKNII
jgi:hypothetical protein